MAYFAPYVDSAGLHLPVYQDVLDDNLQGYLNIYGQNQYVGVDSAIYQMLSIISLKHSDTMQALMLAYNQSSPLTAIGAGLDRVIKMNGLERLPYGFSTALLTVSGAAGTVINNGYAQDLNGNQWALPSPVIIPNGGTTTVTATCTTPGAISALAGTINIIATPVAGWTSVTNPSAAVLGPPVEADSKLRARQALSVALPSRTMLAGTVGGLAATLGVTRYLVLENPTGSADTYGNPAHSITCVVEGGADLAVATAIYLNKGIGAYTNGTTAVQVTDPDTGNVSTINFYRPGYVPVYIGLAAHGVQGFTSATVIAIQDALVSYLNGLQIGEAVTLSALYAAAMAVMPSLTNPQFSIKSLTLGTAASGFFTATVDSGGTGGYQAGDVVSIDGGDGNGTIAVAAVDGSGKVTALAGACTTPGSGYSIASGVGTTGGHGSGLTVNITAVEPTGTSDLSIYFYQVAQGLSANVAVASV